jgi:hypothetical protein
MEDLNFFHNVFKTLGFVCSFSNFYFVILSCNIKRERERERESVRMCARARVRVCVCARVCVCVCVWGGGLFSNPKYLIIPHLSGPLGARLKEICCAFLLC